MGEVLYRRWRPRSFSELVGQEAITRTLTNAVAQGRVAHAYLFCGPRGTGKTTAGRLLAKAVNCLSVTDGEPCNQCSSCQDFLQGRSLDLIEMDAASNRGIDEVRKLRERVGLAPAGRYKVYLIDEVHMLTLEANNALLKTLEEPPPHVIFVLATTEPHKVPPTIISRCQRFDFRRLPPAAMVGRLAHICQQEGFSLEEEALEAIAKNATGSLRDAINTLEQLVAYYGPSPSLAQVQEALGVAVDERAKLLVRHLLAGDLAAGLGTIVAAREDGIDMRQWQRRVVEYLRALILQQVGVEGRRAEPQARQGAASHPEGEAGVRALVAKTPAERLWRALRAFAEVDLRADPQSSLPLELALAEYLLEQGLRPARFEAPPDEAPRGVPGHAAVPGAPAPELPGQPQGSAAAGLSPRPRPERGGWGDAAPAARLADSYARAGAGAPAAPPAAMRPASQVAIERAPEGDDESRGADPQLPAGTWTAPFLEQGDAGPGPAVPEDFLDKLRLTCKKANVRVGALLNGSCQVESFADGVVTLGFFRSFHKENVEAPENRQLVEEMASRLLGQRVTLQCVMTERRSPPPRANGGHLLRAAQEMGARPLRSGQIAAPPGQG
ncbi:MAG TPA: DNA polymerase III subunit gamma/tau [Dehalococcoidia bacterium]|nr:DNA polymerase III subunit gamma/tau [Dehalococcoidia bacterium]